MTRATKSELNQPEHVTTGNAIDDLGFAPEELPALEPKAVVWSALHDEIAASAWKSF
jgi:hypothetical protein